MTVDGISSKSLVATIATHLAMLKREARYPRRTGLPVLVLASAAPGYHLCHQPQVVYATPLRGRMGHDRAQRPVSSANALVYSSRPDGAGSAGHVFVHQASRSCWQPSTRLSST